MRRGSGSVQLVLGAALIAGVFYAILALPGFVSDRDSTVPVHAVRETHR
jgi:hypothetical protein